jgi:hypothetical protein
VSRALAMVALIAVAHAAAAQTTSLTTLHGAPNGTNRLNIIIVPDGFTAPELQATQGDQTWPITNTKNAAKSWKVVCDTIVQKMFKVDAFASHKDLFHIRRMDVTAQGSGTPQSGFPANHKHANRAGFSRFALGAHPDGVYPSDVDKANDEAKKLVAGQTCDLLLIVANTEVYGGSAFQFNTSPGQLGVGVTSLHCGDRQIPEVDQADICNEFTTYSFDWTHSTNHEIAHGLFNLSDEYADFDRPTSEPANANLTLVSDPRVVKWKHWIDAGRVGSPVDNGKGVYHPAKACKMNGDPKCRFCAVCEERIATRTFQQLRLIDRFTPAQDDVSATSTAGLTFTIDLVPAGKIVGDRAYVVDWYVNNQLRTSTSSTGTAETGESHTLTIPPGTLHAGSNEVSCVVAPPSRFIDPRGPRAPAQSFPNSRRWTVRLPSPVVAETGPRPNRLRSGPFE